MKKETVTSIIVIETIHSLTILLELDSMTTEYTHRQIIYSLNSISNLPSNRVGRVETLESDAKDLMNKLFSNSNIINLIGK